MITRNRILNFHNNKKTFIGFLVSLLSMIVLSVGCSCFSNIDYGTKMANIIRMNNKTNSDGKTFWRCEPIESRTDWLGWGIKSYLTSLANPWAVYGDLRNNHCFFYTSSSSGQTFIRDKLTGEVIPISVFASPSSRSLSCFNIRLRDRQAVNTKYGFYCSERLASLLNDDLDQQQLIVNCGKENISNVTFDGVVKTFGYDFINELIAENDLYIIVPYMLRIDGRDEIISYDMQRFTGQSSFYAVLKDDKYENNYYTLIIDKIYQMAGVKDQLCYKGTYIDSFVDFTNKYEFIDSSVQRQYIDLNGNNTEIMSYKFLGAVLIVFSLIILCVLIFGSKFNFYSIDIFSIIVSSSLALIIFWVFGEIFYETEIPNILFWGIESRAFTFIFIVFATILISLILTFKNNNKHKGYAGVSFQSIDI